ncbi:hypothetical protein [Sphingomonas sp.]|uniref:hypothetical protein n=1 Tax=Sphingomonas sp. TaxID=28214 RepID=UPI002FD91256
MNADPECLALIVLHAEKRVTRAAVKQRAANREMSDPLDALEQANARLAACPDVQLSLLQVIA